MTETEFIQRTEGVLQFVGDALDASDLDCDWDVSNGILTITLDGVVLVLNRHLPNRELWFAAATTGAAHFRLDSSGKWLDTRSGEALASTIGRALARQTDTIVDLSAIS